MGHSEASDAGERSRVTGWTRFVAGVTAHEVNNAAHAISTALTLTRADGEGATLGLLADVAARLQRLGSALRVLACASRTQRSERLDKICQDAVAQVGSAGAQVAVDPISPGIVRVDVDALRLVLMGMISHTVEANAPATPIRVRASVTGVEITIEVAGPDARGISSATPLPFERLIGAMPELRADLSLVLAATITHELGGVLLVGRGSPGGRTLLLRVAGA